MIDPDKMMGKFFDLLKDLIKNGFDTIWFTWLGWAVLSAGLYALGKKGDSQILVGIAIFSGILLVLKTVVDMEQLLKITLPKFEIEGKPSFMAILYLFTVLIIFVMSILSEIFRAIILN